MRQQPLATTRGRRRRILVAQPQHARLDGGERLELTAIASNGACASTPWTSGAETGAAASGSVCRATAPTIDNRDVRRLANSEIPVDPLAAQCSTTTDGTAPGALASSRARCQRS